MKALPSMNSQKGFSLIEVIATLVIAGIMGVIFTTLMQSALKGSSESVDYVAGDADGTKVMEQIIADYVEQINTDPENVLVNIIQNKTDGKYGEQVDMQYIEFNASGHEDASIPPSYNTLKITIHTAGKDIINILTRSRKAGDPPLRY